MKYVLSCDWFAYSCVSRWGFYNHKGHTDEVAQGLSYPADGLFKEILDESGQKMVVPAKVYQVYSAGSKEFKVFQSRECSPLFYCTVLVRCENLDICHLSYGHKRESNSMKCVAKVDNSLLYSSDWHKLFIECLDALGWKRVGISRVDICADFEFFYNQRSPSLFIRDYLSDPTESRPSFVRRGSNKYRVVGERFVSHNSVDTISWGNRDSPVQVNLYNKSKELEQVHMKPYIVSKWLAAGLVHGMDEHGKEHQIWRAELSLKPAQIAIRAKNKSEIRDFSICDFSSQQSLLSTWSWLLPRYFQFYFLSLRDSSMNRKVKDLKPVQLFDVEGAVDVAPFIVSRQLKSGRSERLLARRLRGLNVYAESDKEADSIRDVAKMFDRLALSNELRELIDTETILGKFIHGVRCPQDIISGTISKEQSRRLAERWAKLLAAGRPLGYSSFDDALQQLQSDVNVVERLLSEAYKALPDEAATLAEPSYL